MFEQIWEWISRLFGRNKKKISSSEYNKNQAYNRDYMESEKINFTAIFAQRLATLAVSDSSASIPDENMRAAVLDEVFQEVWGRIKKITASALGCGGCVIVPYVKGGKLYYNTVKQSRLIIHEMDGEKITGATILSDSITIDDRVYYRFTDYVIIENTLYITHRSVTQYGSDAIVPEWESIQDMAIGNVDRVPFGFIKSPINNRGERDFYGVSITYGCGMIISQIMECLEQIKEEFELKRVRLQVDERVLDKDPKTGKLILKDKLFMKGYSEDGKLFNIYDPAIRESSHFARLEKLFELLERQIGTSKGILTAPASFGATATEIRAAMSDTYALISDIRKAIEKGLEDFVIACNVLLNVYTTTPQGKHDIKFDWSYALIESSSETWQQMKDLQSIGGMSKAELRQFVTGEDIEEAQKAVDEIKDQEPSLSSLMGMNE